MSTQIIEIDRNDGTAPFLVPVQPGCTEIQGTCGLGKSLTLEMVNVLADGDQKDRLKATAGQAGTKVKGLGVTLTITPSRVTSKGDLEVGASEDYPLEGLIYPPRQGETEKNEYGIKCFVRMSKAKADPTEFHHLIGTAKEFSAVIPPEAVKTNDLVDMANKVKRVLQAMARTTNQDAEREEQAAAGDRDAMKDLDRKTETDAAKLQQTHTEAVQRHASLKTSWDAYWNAQDAAAEARQKLAAATGSGKTIEQYRAEHVAATNVLANASRIAGEIQAQLDRANAEVSRAVQACNAAREATEQAERFAHATEAWQQTIDNAAGGKQPDEDELLAAETAVETARQALEQGAVIRAALAREAAAKRHQDAADEFRKKAHKLLQSADGTDAVLSKAVASGRFSVRGEFLMGTLPDGTTQPLYTMSDGQRSQICILEKIDRLVQHDPSPRLKIADIGQRIRQDIPDLLWDELCQYAYDHQVCLVTGRVTDAPKLHAVVWTPKGAK